ncbi:hypothetical protein MKSMC1_25870 [Mycobacterium kansasii]|nr:hypothetical protein MKSMC1_25870 [Mycobacterium kansasii]
MIPALGRGGPQPLACQNPVVPDWTYQPLRRLAAVLLGERRSQSSRRDCWQRTLVLWRILNEFAYDISPRG